MVRVEVVLLGVVVGRCGDDHEIGVTVGCRPVERGGEVKPALHAVGKFPSEIFLYVFVLDGTDAAVDLLDFLGYDIHSRDFVVLSEQRRYAQADVSRAGHRYLYVLEISHISFFIFSPRRGAEAMSWPLRPPP